MKPKRNNAPAPKTRSDLKARWPDEQYAAYLVKRGLPLPEKERDDDVIRWHEKITGIWKKWHDMQGDNPPMVRDMAGPRRDFDINLDGLAHYGMLPDFLQDMRNQGMDVQDFAPLFRSANDYVEVWARCEERSAALKEANPEPVK